MIQEEAGTHQKKKRPYTQRKKREERDQTPIAESIT